MPSATMPTAVATGMRSPRMQGTPPIWAASTVMRRKRGSVMACLLRRLTTLLSTSLLGKRKTDSNALVESVSPLAPRSAGPAFLPFGSAQGGLAQDERGRGDQHSRCGSSPLDRVVWVSSCSSLPPAALACGQAALIRDSTQKGTAAITVRLGGDALNWCG